MFKYLGAPIDGNGTIEFPEFLIMMARQCAMTTDKEHLHWQETFRVFTTPDRLPGTTTRVWINKSLRSSNISLYMSIFSCLFYIRINNFLLYNIQINEKGETETVLPKTVEQAGLDKEPKVTQRNLPIDEFRYHFYPSYVS